MQMQKSKMPSLIAWSQRLEKYLLVRSTDCFDEINHSFLKESITGRVVKRSFSLNISLLIIFLETIETLLCLRALA